MRPGKVPVDVLLEEATYINQVCLEKSLLKIQFGFPYKLNEFHCVPFREIRWFLYIN